MTEQPFGDTGVGEETLEEQMIRLEDSNNRLAGDVRALTETLQVVNRLAADQEAMREATHQTEQKIDAVDISTTQQISRTRRASLLGILTALLLIPAVSILVFLSLIEHVNQLLDEQNRSSYSSCRQRNMATTENANREDLLSRLETNPQIVRVHTQSAIKLRTSLINCNIYLARLHHT